MTEKNKDETQERTPIESPLDLFQRLFTPFANDLKSSKRIQGNDITFVEWYHYIARAWRDFPEGFFTEITSVTEIGKVWGQDDEVFDDRQVVLVVRVTDMLTNLYHEASGSAPVAKMKVKYGGALAEAESQALRRAFAKFGLGLEMYMDEEDLDQANPDEEEAVTDMTKDQIARMKQLVAAGEDNPAVTQLAKDLRKNVSKARDKRFHVSLAIDMMEEQLQKEGIDVPDPS